MVNLSTWFGSEDCLSIDFGSSALKVVQAKSISDQEINLSVCDAEPVETDSSVDIDSYREALQTIVSRNSLSKNQDSFLTLPTNSVIVRHMELPAVDDERISKVIEYEAESDLPFPLESVVTDYQVIEKNAEKTRVLLVVAKKENLQKYISVLRNVDLRPKNIEISAFSLFNIYRKLSKQSVDQDSQPGVLVDVGHSYTDIIIHRDDRLHYARSASIGGESMTDSLQNELDVEYEEAERLKRDYGHVALHENRNTNLNQDSTEDMTNSSTEVEKTPPPPESGQTESREETDLNLETELGDKSKGGSSESPPAPPDVSGEEEPPSPPDTTPEEKPPSPPGTDFDKQEEGKGSASESKNEDPSVEESPDNRSPAPSAPPSESDLEDETNSKISESGSTLDLSEPEQSSSSESDDQSDRSGSNSNDLKPPSPPDDESDTTNTLNSTSSTDTDSTDESDDGLFLESHDDSGGTSCDSESMSSGSEEDDEHSSTERDQTLGNSDSQEIDNELISSPDETSGSSDSGKSDENSSDDELSDEDIEGTDDVSGEDDELGDLSLGERRKPDEDNEKNNLGAAANKSSKPPINDDVDREKIGNVMRNQVDRIIDELRQTLEYYQTEVGGDEIKHIKFCGQGSKINNITEYVQDDMKRETSIFEPEENIVGTQEHDPQSMLVASGLTLRKNSQHTQVGINLIPDSIQKQKEEEKQQFKYTFMGILGILVVAQFLGWAYLKYDQRWQELQRSEEELNKVKPIVSRVEELENIKERLDTRLSIIRRLERNQVRILPILDGLKELPMMNSTWFENFSISSSEDRSTLRITGITSDYQSVSKFDSWMQEREFVQNKVSNSQKQSRNKVNGKSLVQFKVSYILDFVSINENKSLAKQTVNKGE